MLENPLRWFFRKTTLPGTPYDHRNYGHLIAPCGCSDSSVKWNRGSTCNYPELSFRLSRP
jgi:hypothetical protein